MGVMTRDGYTTLVYKQHIGVRFNNLLSFITNFSINAHKVFGSDLLLIEKVKQMEEKTTFLDG